jgi:electron-transferring-flavoprotein dehydrogenase
LRPRIIGAEKFIQVGDGWNETTATKGGAFREGDRSFWVQPSGASREYDDRKEKDWSRRMRIGEQEVVHTDILIVGGGPAGLATAIHLADLVNGHNQKIESGEVQGDRLPSNIILLEKGAAIGNHILSGAVINPATLRELVPDIPEQDIPFDSPVGKDEFRLLTKNQDFKIPFHPPYMSNKGNYVASLGKITRWLAGIAEKKGVQIYPGFSGYEMLYENGHVAGVRTGDSGLDRHGNPQENYQPGTHVYAKVPVLAEGSRGHLAKKLIRKLGLDKERNPQVYSIGVKELWQVPEGTFEAGRVLHSLGYPLSLEQFGGGFVYGFSNHRVAVGLVVGLDYLDPTFDPHHALQIYKRHPSIKKILENGKIIQYGAKTIPEGGFFSMPQFYHGGVLLVGDSAGFLSMPSLKGIHLAMDSGMMAAKTAYEALKARDYSEKQLSRYEELFKQSAAYKDLYPVRNFRQGFRKNLLYGMIHFGAQLVTGGHGLSLKGRLEIQEDSKRYRELSELDGKTFMEKFKNELVFDKKLTFDKQTDVFFSGTQHDEHQPTHCGVLDQEALELSIERYGAPCQYFCPAGVYELVNSSKTGEKEIRIHSTNCVHCKTCDIKAPFGELEWMPPYGGDGPEYEEM